MLPKNLNLKIDLGSIEYRAGCWLLIILYPYGRVISSEPPVYVRDTRDLNRKIQKGIPCGPWR